MIKIFEYENRPIQFEVIDGNVMANATVMCQAFKRQPNDWRALLGTKRYIEAITRKNGISDNQLVTTRHGNPESGGGTWIDEKLILNLARWLDVDFEVWCDEKIAELLRTGKTSLYTLSPAEALLQTVQQLVNHERQIIELQSGYRQIEAEVKEITSQLTSRPDYYTISGYASKKSIKVGNDLAKPLGRKAAKICKERAIQVDRVNDPKWGSVGSYPSMILEELFIDEGLIK